MRALKGESAEAGNPDAVIVAGGAIVDVHRDNKQHNVDNYNGRDQPWEPFLGKMMIRRWRRIAVLFGGRGVGARVGWVALAGLDFDP